MRRIRDILSRLALAAATVVLVAVAVDLLAWFVFDVRPKGWRVERLFQFSPQYGHFHRPGAEGYWYRNLLGEKYSVRINSLGFADSERSLQKTRPRIALIGDSTTEFWEMDERERGQHVLEELLGGEYEVLNMGVRGYGTDQTLLLFQDVGVRFRPDIVVYTFCINDIDDNATRLGKPYFELDADAPAGLALRNRPVASPKPQPRRGPLYRYSFVNRVLRESRDELRRNQRLRRLLGGPRYAAPNFEIRCYLREYDEADERRMEVTRRLISALARSVAENGAHFMVVEGLYKPAADPALQRRAVETCGDVFDFDTVTRILREHCAAEGIPFVSLRERLGKEDLPVSQLIPTRDNMHLNARGARFWAECVADGLRAPGRAPGD